MERIHITFEKDEEIKSQRTQFPDDENNNISSNAMSDVSNKELNNNEKIFNKALSEMDGYYSQEINQKKTGLDWILHCIHCKEDSNNNSTINNLAKNTSKLFPVIFPRGYQKILTLGYIREKGAMAFTNGKFDIVKFKAYIHLAVNKEFIEENDKKNLQTLLNNLDHAYLRNITLDPKNKHVTFGKSHYAKNTYDLSEIIVNSI